MYILTGLTRMAWLANCLKNISMSILSHTSSDHQVQFLEPDKLGAMRGRVSWVADTKLVLLIAHLIRQPGSIPGVGMS